jgi:hypothetical protein
MDWRASHQERFRRAGGTALKGTVKKFPLVINVGNLCYDNTAFTKQITSMVAV